MTLNNLVKALFVGTAVAGASLPQKSDAAIIPYMTIDTSVTNANYDGNPANGNENLFSYTITNFGDGIAEVPEDDGSAYNGISFTLQAGSNQSVYGFGVPYLSGWNASINPDSTTFSGGSLTPGDFITFELYADDATPTGIVQATALAAGGPSIFDVPFRDYDNGNLSSNQYVSVTAPIPEPRQMALLLGVGAGALAGLRRRYSSKAEEKPITYEK